MNSEQRTMDYEQRTNRKKLTRKQLAVLDEIFLGELDEQQVLDRYKVERGVYYRWLGDDDFAEQFDRRIAAAYRQSAALVARYATVAAAKLVQLTDSTSPETARKACLDIITYHGLQARERHKTYHERQATSDEPAASGLSPETASKILEVLAQQEDGRQTTDDKRRATGDTASLKLRSAKQRL